MPTAVAARRPPPPAIAAAAVRRHADAEFPPPDAPAGRRRARRNHRRRRPCCSVGEVDRPAPRQQRKRRFAENNQSNGFLPHAALPSSGMASWSVANRAANSFFRQSTDSPMNQPPSVAASPPPDHHDRDDSRNHVISLSLHGSFWHLQRASGMDKSLPLTLPP
jgi:hypothetical protein